MQEWLRALVEGLSWASCAAYCLSFLGQIRLNHTLKSVEGMSLNFLAANINCYFLYALTTTLGYWFSSHQTGLVPLCELLLSYFGLAANLVLAAQACLYPRGNNQAKLPVMVGLALLWVFVLVYSVLTMGSSVSGPSPDDSIVGIMVYLRIVLSTLKYIPQILWNMARHSTQGWSIHFVVFDIVGGLLLTTQKIVLAVFGESLNTTPTKFIITFIGLALDKTFIVQYCRFSRHKLPLHKQVAGDHQQLTYK